MSDQDTARDDLAYIRSMTERAANAPLLGGRFLMWWGGLLTLAYCLHFLTLSDVIPGAPMTFAILWFSYGTIGMIGQAVLSLTMARKPGKSAIGNRVERQIWCGAGLGVFAFVIGVLVATTALGADLIFWDFIAAPALGLYGLAFLATAIASGQSWMKRPAWAALLSAGLVPLLAGTTVLYAGLAVIVFTVVFVPGLILIRAEPAGLAEDAASGEGAV